MDATAGPWRHNRTQHEYTASMVIGILDLFLLHVTWLHDVWTSGRLVQEVNVFTVHLDKAYLLIYNKNGGKTFLIIYNKIWECFSHRIRTNQELNTMICLSRLIDFYLHLWSSWIEAPFENIAHFSGICPLDLKPFWDVMFEMHNAFHAKRPFKASYTLYRLNSQLMRMRWKTDSK